MRTPAARSVAAISSATVVGLALGSATASAAPRRARRHRSASATVVGTGAVVALVRRRGVVGVGLRPGLDLRLGSTPFGAASSGTSAAVSAGDVVGCRGLGGGRLVEVGLHRDLLVPARAAVRPGPGRAG